MPRMLFVLALFVLLVPVQTILAGPPEGASGKMVFDEVADGLRRYRKEVDGKRRLKILDRLARTGDPRVAVTLWEAIVDGRLPDSEFGPTAGLFRHFGVESDLPAWWERYGADLRRRAKQLP